MPLNYNFFFTIFIAIRIFMCVKFSSENLNSSFYLHTSQILILIE